MEIADLPKDKKIILFDGVCNLCDSAVHFIIKQDKKDIFRFVALQSELGQKISKHIGVNQTMEGIVLYEPGKAYYYKAQAVVQICVLLKGIYQLMKVFSLLPQSFSNSIYDYIAKNRYKWYGKKEACLIPTPEISAKFLA